MTWTATIRDPDGNTTEVSGDTRLALFRDIKSRVLPHSYCVVNPQDPKFSSLIDFINKSTRPRDAEDVRIQMHITKACAYKRLERLCRYGYIRRLTPGWYVGLSFELKR